MIEINNNSKLRQHYSEIARKFTYAKFISLFILVLFVLFAFHFYREDITIENFRYMIKYLDFEAPSSTASVGTSVISFDGETAVGLVLFRNDIAVLGRTGLDMYDIAGQKIFSSEYTMNSPTAVCGNKYMLVFDIGGTYAAVFNAFSKIWEVSFEYPILDAAVNDRGDFCIVTSEKGYTSAVYVYNSDFEQIYRWRSGDKYVIDVAMSAKENDKFILSTLRAENGFYTGEILLLSSDADERIASTSLYDQMIMEVSDFTDTVTVLSDKSLTFFNAQTLEKQSSFSFSRDSLQNFKYNEKYSVLVLSKKIIGSENEIVVYSSGGEHINTFSSRGHITDICLAGDSMYLLSSGELTIYNLETFEKNVLEVDKHYDRIISDDSTVIMASSNDAVTIKGE